ncbi:hypothetical protein LOZ61_004373 [Ophidiomyces ophidiicola]|nr:hypothetical protein LOZ61_004373 [Ophidiomyces ophidiicola]KAI1925674.1 hypothetical protein LOZ60_003995 [Ophidiomyces ophidiicola]KAI1955590.1 hypothetical protein LOZ59_004463 [Ophidiomyces ophidiicola]KAI2123992.1 hypothetical protein LOZ31_004351 [Ophidiomyces ophidiicola]KAI2138687.1 hypothetical protein LOZ27_005484 [Ophidiomyces ophidiicola]
MEDPIAQDHQPVKPKGRKKSKKAKKKAPLPSIVLQHGLTLDMESSGAGHPDPPCTSPPTYTSTPGPVTSLTIDEAGQRPISPTAQSISSIDAPLADRRKQPSRGNKKAKPKTAIMVMEEPLRREWADDQPPEEARPNGAHVPPYGSDAAGGGQRSAHGDLHGELLGRDGLEIQEQERDETNGVIVNGAEKTGVGVVERAIMLVEEDRESVPTPVQQIESVFQKLSETGLNVFDTQKAPSGEALGLFTEDTAVETPNDIKKKEKKVKNKEKKKKKAKALVASLEEAGMPQLPTNDAEVKNESETPLRQREPSAKKDMRIKLDVDLEIELLSKMKVKGEIMVTFL